VLQFARRFPERLLHPLRRYLVRRRLRGMPPPTSMLVVCYGNICRSPYGEAALRRFVSAFSLGRIRVDSAGFIGPHRAPPPEARDVAASRGLDLSRHQSKLLSPELARGSDLILVMDGQQASAIHHQYGVATRRIVVLGDLDPEPIKTRAIKDPVEQPRPVFEESYDRIDRCLDVLVHSVRWAPGRG